MTPEEQFEQWYYNPDTQINSNSNGIQTARFIFLAGMEAGAQNSTEEITRLSAKLEAVKYDRSVKHDMAAEQIQALTEDVERWCAIAEQITTDWIPANKKLSAIAERYRQALTEIEGYLGNTGYDEQIYNIARAALNPTKEESR